MIKKTQILWIILEPINEQITKVWDPVWRADRRSVTKAILEWKPGIKVDQES